MPEQKLGKARLLLFSLIAAAGFFAASELSLRLVHFRFQRSLSYMQFGYPSKIELHRVFIADPELLFRMKPGSSFGTLFGSLNRQGFRGKDFEKAKPAGLIRIACLGDSVTFGIPGYTYPDMLKQILNRNQPGEKFQVYNFGVPGYSSWQGKRLLGQVISEYHPEVIVIFYGWNDHWLARGFSDHEQKVKKDVPLILLRDELSGLRVYQLLNKVIAQAAIKFSKTGQDKLRVPLDQYRANLKEMIQAAASNRASVILTTAPAGLGLGPLPDYLEAIGFIRQGQDLQQLHETYNQAVRSSAGAEGAQLVDLDLIFKERGVKNLFDRPEKDIIHPNRAGIELIAESIAGAIIKSNADIKKEGNR